MIELYTWNAADGHSVASMLEATRLPYSVFPVDSLNPAEQPQRFQTISPNKIPAIRDPDGPAGEEINIFGCLPVLLYLAEKTGHFIPEPRQQYYQCLQWVNWQQSDAAPALTQLHEVLDHGGDQLPVALEHQVRLLWQALANQLSGRRFICGEDLTIADIALYPWVKPITHPSVDPKMLPPLASWLEQLDDIDFMCRGLHIP